MDQNRAPMFEAIEECHRLERSSAVDAAGADTVPAQRGGDVEPSDFLDRVRAARAVTLRCVRWFRDLESVGDGDGRGPPGGPVRRTRSRGSVVSSPCRRPVPG